MKKVLLDENLDRRLVKYFSAAFDVISVPDLGWQSKKNGELLTAMDTENIGYLVTADRNLRFQQNLEKYSVIVVVLLSFDVRLKSLTPFMEKIESSILKADASQRIIEIDLRDS